VIAMPTTRARTSADIMRELSATEQRFVSLFERWHQQLTSQKLVAEGAQRVAQLDAVEEVLRQQRGAIDRLHQLWIEYAQASGIHAPE
jgi:hypothetical protein